MQQEPLIDDIIGVIVGTFTFDLGRYLIAAGLMAAIVALLMRSDWRSRKIQARRATTADVRRELLLSLRTVAVYAVVGMLTMAGLRAGLITDGGESAGALANAGYVLAMVVAHDAYFYWVHRAMHHRKLFRHFHRSHHRTITPTPWAAYAFDVPEAVVMALYMPLWLFLVPTPHVAIFVFLAIMIVRNVMGHAGMELHGRGWASHPVLKWVSTTTHHDLHHSGGFGSNYGFYFTFWDKVMGTEHPDYVRIYDEVTAKPAKGDVPRLSGRLVMGGFLAAVLSAAALPLA
jgi:Delta7-sterol 5-desaturase